MGIENIIEKVRKLLARADAERNDNEHEREIALRQAHRLLAKHGLEMADVEATATDAFGDLESVDFWIKPGDWRTRIYNAAADLHACRMLFKSRRGGTLVYFIGRELRATVARSIAGYLVTSIEREIRARRKQFASMHAHAFATDFGNGASIMVQHKVAQILAEQARGNIDGERLSRDRALVLVGQHEAALSEIADLVSDRFPKVTDKKARPVCDSAATRAGVAFGKGLSLNPQISGGASRKQIGGAA